MLWVGKYTAAGPDWPLDLPMDAFAEVLESCESLDAEERLRSFEALRLAECVDQKVVKSYHEQLEALIVAHSGDVRSEGEKQSAARRQLMGIHAKGRFREK